LNMIELVMFDNPCLRCIALSFWGFSMAFACDTVAQNCGCTNCPQPIPDESVTDLFIQVSNATNPILGQKGQGLCGVELFFQHEYIGDLEIVLTSPSGQKVTLVAPVDFFPNPGGGGATDGTVWNIRFVQCNDAADPDPGFMPKWDNQQPWGVFGNYSGSYYPNLGCLETLAGPVNGVWKLTITDGNAEDEGFFADYRLIFCDPSGITCYSCEASAGNLLQPDISACAGDSTLKIKLPPTYTALNPAPKSPGYQYIYIVSGKGGVIQRYDSIPDLRKDTAGVYTICGLSFIGAQKNDLPKPDGKFTVQQLSNLLNSANAPVCGDVTTNCVNVTIHPIPSDIRDTVIICAPDCYTFGARTLCAPGIYTDTLQKNGCRYFVHFMAECYCTRYRKAE
jgi:subtilisin-like proprotein convertase family protein